ncbi:hypothetical protein COEREDRAFT_79521, partial [Coemansia reversa NRRL 1564]
MVQAAQQGQALKSELTDARNAAAEQKQKYEALEIKLAGTIETATEEKQKREKLEVKLADAVEIAFQMGQHYEELEAKLTQTLESATEEKQKREALDVELANVRGAVGELKQERGALKKAREDAEFAAVISTMRCERLEFELEDEQDKVEDLTRELNTLDNAVERVQSANAELIDNMKHEWHEELQQSDQRCQALRDALKKAREEVEYVADLPKLRCDRLEFELEDAQDKVEELTQQCNSLEKTIEKERLTNAESIDNIKGKWYEELHQSDQQCLALRNALEKVHEAAKEENFERKIMEHLLADAREAVVKQNQQSEDRCEAMQRKHLAEIERLHADTQLKPAEIAQSISPPSTPRDINGDEFTTEHCSNSATAESM